MRSIAGRRRGFQGVLRRFIVRRSGRAVAAAELAQPAFLTQNLHHPVGLIVPSTRVQALGG
jgi:hypothetical protein